MSTHSRIGIVLEDGTVKSIQCNGDGQVDNTGLVLDQFYSEPEDIHALINLGEIRSLKQDIDITYAYHRDNDEELNGPDISESAAFYFNEEILEYIYLYRDGEWFVKKPANGEEPMTVDEYLIFDQE